MDNRRHSSETHRERVYLQSLDVTAIFEMLKATTSYFSISNYASEDIMTQCPFHGNGHEQNPSFGICYNRK